MFNFKKKNIVSIIICLSLFTSIILNAGVSRAAGYSAPIWDHWKSNFYYQSRVLKGGREQYRIGNKKYSMGNIPYASYSRYLDNYENAINECNRHIDRAIIAAVGVDVSVTAHLYSGSAATTFGKITGVAGVITGSALLYELYGANDCYCTASQNFNKLHSALGYSTK